MAEKRKRLTLREERQQAWEHGYSHGKADATRDILEQLHKALGLEDVLEKLETVDIRSQNTQSDLDDLDRQVNA